MEPSKIKATELLKKYIQIVGSNCEHDSYCKDAACNTKLRGYTLCKVDLEKAKQCALLCVETIINAHSYLICNVRYWQEVKLEIENYGK